MSDEPIVAALACGLLSPIFDRVNVRQERRKLTELQFDAVVVSLFEDGLIATDAVENGFVH